MIRKSSFFRQFICSLRRGAIFALGLALLAITPRPASAITVTDSSDVWASGDGICTLRDAVQRALDLSSGNVNTYPECKIESGQDVIEFAANVTLIELTPSQGAMHLSSNLTIQGKSLGGKGTTPTISGKKGTRIFEIGSDLKIRLLHLTLIDGAPKDSNGVLTGGGGALLVQGGAAVVTIDDCTFSGNKADFGGAISFHAYKLSIANSTFNGNRADKTDGGALEGGASGGFGIVNTFFDGNFSEKSGGALACDGGQGLKITESVFAGNVATATEADKECFKGDKPDCTEGGGAVVSGCDTDILHTVFISNAVFGQLGGGAMYLTSSGKGKVVESIFTLNNAGFGSPNHGNGGAIYARGNLLVDRCDFAQNYARAGLGGGALFFQNSKSDVANSILRRNRSQLDDSMSLTSPPKKVDSGAAIAVIGSQSQVEIVNSSLAEDYGEDELFLGIDGEIILKNTLIGAWFTTHTCGGDLLMIFDGDSPSARNIQSEQGATCQGISTKLTGTNSSLLKTFPGSLPGGYDLTFTYMYANFASPADGKGDPVTCQAPPVGTVDILGNSRLATCTIGAVEKPN